MSPLDELTTELESVLTGVTDWCCRAECCGNYWGIRQRMPGEKLFSEKRSRCRFFRSQSVVVILPYRGMWRFGSQKPEWVPKRALKEVHHATEIINKDINFSSQSVRKTKARVAASGFRGMSQVHTLTISLSIWLMISSKSSLCNSHYFLSWQTWKICLRGLTTMKLPTEKLRQVIRLIHDDSHSNRVIGMTVGVSPNTVKNVRDLLRLQSQKLGWFKRAG